MEHTKNHFLRTIEIADVNIVDNSIVGSFSENYVAGQYIWIRGTLLNDGVYKIFSVESDRIVVENDLINEQTDESFTLAGLGVPKDFLSMVGEIEGYTSKDGIASESIDDYSASFSNGDGGWTTAFSGRLKKYKKLFSDEYSVLSRYDIRSKSHDY